jgi:hypothetical protein
VREIQPFPEITAYLEWRAYVRVVLKQLVFFITRCLSSTHYGVAVIHALDIVLLLKLQENLQCKRITSSLEGLGAVWLGNVVLLQR